ncbi:hypothetical protein WICMUC_002662 [Wickerhamomyces mucosus]|uniref:Uncharacterized protein n=1 Tax=Wickerhamomyces mucosus TaxID=1378264 RepID=A0A9P8TDK3_9ASCO|nr:hypothetical protein WICMUC_002662 [Wickerhamomyces mucosus]
MGLTLQRKSHLITTPHNAKIIFRIGLLLFISSNLIGSSIQIKTLPLIILSPLQSIGLVFNSIFAALLLDESFTKTILLGTGFIIIGALFIGFFNSLIEDNNFTNDEIYLLLKRPEFLSLIVILNLFIIITILLSNLFKLSNSFKSILYALYSGIFSSNSLLFAKISILLVSNLISNKRSIKNLLDLRIWIIVSIFILMAVLQLVFLNKGLRKLSPSILYPLIFCIYNFLNIFNQFIFFNQFIQLSQIVMIFIGTTSVIIGVILLNLKTTINDNDDVSPSSEIEGGIKLKDEDEDQDLTSSNRISNIREEHSFKGERVLSFEQSELLMELTKS